MNILEISRGIASDISTALIENLAKHGYQGETLTDPQDLKSAHEIDYLVADIVRLHLGERQDVNVYIESVDPKRINPDAKHSFYIDPLDGSLNWERGVGDPSVVIAYGNCPAISTLDDLDFAYVRGLRSGDEYYTEGNTSIYRNYLTKRNSVIHTNSTRMLGDAVAYLRPGYGLARHQLEVTLPLFYESRDIRAIDNAGIEWSEISRGAADVMVEARKGSDFYNLLGWPILRNAGGYVATLSGEDLAKKMVDFDAKYDYIAACSKELVAEVLKTINTNCELGGG